MDINDRFLLVLAIITASIATARMTRLLVDDAWPPVKRFRERYVNRVGDEWEPLFECPFCVSAYFALPQVIWFAAMVNWPDAWWLSVPWWIGNGWFALMYVAALINVRDLPSEQR